MHLVETIKALRELAIQRAGDLFQNGTLKSWEEVAVASTLTTMIHRFQFHRIRHAMTQLLGEDLIEPPEVKELTYIIKTDTAKQIVTNIYKLALSHRIHKYTKARLAWQSDLKVIIDDTMWTYCCNNTKSISLHGRHRLIHFKYINRVYYTPERLHRYGLRDDATCDRCRFSSADFLHLACNCPGIALFWGKIFRELSSIVAFDIPPDPALALIGYSETFPKQIRRLLDMGLLMAKRRVALHWMKGPLPTVTQWSRDLLYCCTQTETFSELLPPRSRPKNFWGLYTAYLMQQESDTTQEAEAIIDTREETLSPDCEQPD